MRGKLTAAAAVTAATGITPADAGKTCVPTSSRVNPEDHPRGCGENSKCNESVSAYKKSPPRMRGKQRGEADERV